MGGALPPGRGGDGDHLASLSWHRPATGGDGQHVAGHLVIGLGGVGRRTIAELRRTLDQPFGARSPARLAADYLVIDLDGSAAGAAVGGMDRLERPPCDVFTLDMASVRDYATHLPEEVRDWLGRYDAAVEIGSDTAGNPRRLGSLLLAARADALQDWVSARIGALVAAGDGGQVQVHVVGYLAGGIGGGALIQLLAQLRRNPALAGRSRIRVYGLLPAAEEFGAADDDPAASVNTGALLSELAGAQSRRLARPDRADPPDLGLQRLCDEVLVISPPPDTGRVVRDVRTLPEALAMTVRQRITLGAGPLAPDQDSAPALDDKTAPGIRQPLIAAAPKVLTTARDEIEEALAFAVLQAGLFQLIYAHWRPGRGFVAERRDLDHGALVRRADVQTRWMLTVEHLIQSVPVLPADHADAQWRLLADDWKMVIERFMEQAQTRPRRQWLHVVTDLWQQRFATGFRGQGVVAFFQSRHGARRGMARAIRQKVERELLDSWASGEWGLADLLAILDELIALQRERIASVEDRVTNTRMAEDACRVRAGAAYEKWAHLPFWRMGGAKARRLLQVYCIHLHELYVSRTRAEGWLFAKTLLPVVIEELEALRQHLDRLSAVLRQAGQGIELLLDSLAARMENDERTASFVIRLIDHDRLRQLVQSILTDEARQKANANILRQAVLRNAGGDGGLRALADWVGADGWMDGLVAQSREQVVGKGALWGASVREVVGPGIYAALHTATGGEFSRLRDLGARVVDQTIALLPDTAGRRLKTLLYVLLPRDAAQTVFVGALKSALSFSRRTQLRFVETDDDGGAIHMLTVTQPFSIPDVELLRQMDAKYRHYVQCDRDYAMMALHALGSRDELGEDFVLAEEDNTRLHVAAQLLVGMPLRLVVERGDGRLWLVSRDEHGFEDEPMIIGEDLLSAPAQVYGTLASLLEDNVGRALAQALAARGMVERDRLCNAVVEKVMDVRTRCNDDPMDPVYRGFVEAGKAAVAMIRTGAEKAGANGAGAHGVGANGQGDGV